MTISCNKIAKIKKRRSSKCDEGKKKAHYYTY